MVTTTCSSKEHTKSTLSKQCGPGLLIGAFALVLSIVQVATAEEFKPGVYENVILAVDKNGNITGQYEESQGEGVRKSCLFYFKGKAKGGSAEIITWSDRQLPGRLKALKGGIELKVPLGREHPGCGLVLLPDIAEGVTFDLLHQTVWQKLKTVILPTGLHKKPKEPAVPGQDLQEGATVAVLNESGDWLLVETTGGGKLARGWVRKDKIAELR